MKHHSDNLQDHLAYLTRTDSGRILKSSTVFIKDDDGTPCYIFAINYDITNLLAFDSTIKSLTKCRDDEDSAADGPKRITHDVNELLDELIEQSVELVGVPVPFMAEAFKDADIVYPKSWAPFAAMEKRTDLYAKGDKAGIDALEKELLAQNALHKDWACTEELMSTTKDGKALYLHCLPADISGVSCEEGEVDGSVFDRYRDPLYKQASFKPYIIAAMIFLAKFENPQDILTKLEANKKARVYE